jgi:aryl-alcohol dehydrogenase-like predicted oxidoreductase
MDKHAYRSHLNRRTFLRASAAAGAGILAAGQASAKKAEPDSIDRRNERPDRMQYRVLGRTNFNCSRLVFGCGAALAGGKAVRLLEHAYEQGINHYDVGYDDYYKGSERHLAPFIKRHPGDVWITSKAPARLVPGEAFSASLAKGAAGYWLAQLDKSLRRLELDYIDAYYIMGVSEPQLVASDEIAEAFEQAKSAGKVGHFGLSSHQNAQECLEAATDAGIYSLAMIAITPAGWYDYRKQELLSERGTLSDLKPVLDRARAAGIGLVGMKAARPIATEPYGGKYGRVAEDSIVTAFDRYYPERLLQAGLSPYQRSYAYVLENGMDVVNADMQNTHHFEENVLAARNSKVYLA